MVDLTGHLLMDYLSDQSHFKDSQQTTQILLVPIKAVNRLTNQYDYYYYYVLAFLQMKR